MMADPTARDLLSSILDNIEAVENGVAGLEPSAFEADAPIRDAVERCVERIAAALAALGERASDLPAGDIPAVAGELHRATQPLRADLLWTLIGRDLPALKLSTALLHDRQGDD